MTRKGHGASADLGAETIGHVEEIQNVAGATPEVGIASGMV